MDAAPRVAASEGDLAEDRSLRDPLPDSPLGLLRSWLEEAREAGGQRHPEAMTLATVDPGGRPSARVVLCRGFDAEAGYVVFYTDRRSRKGQALAANPWAAAVFHWDALGRQARLEGPVVPSPDAESDAYFATRPRAAQITAWASEQSEPLESREALLARIVAAAERFAAAGTAPVPRPPYWGGYRLYLERVELWVGLEARVHDRVLWQRRLERAADGFAGGPWTLTRLQP